MAAHSCPWHLGAAAHAAPWSMWLRLAVPWGQPQFDPPQHLAQSLLALLAPETIQLLLRLRALQKIHKITHPLAPFLWTRHISTAGQHDPCTALPVTIYIISPSLHPPVSPPSPSAWSTLCKEWVLQPHLVCPR